MLAHTHAKTSIVYSEQCGKISDFQSETTKPTIIINIQIGIISDDNICIYFLKLIQN